MGTAIMDASGQLASSGAGIPGFIGMMHKGVQQMMSKFLPSANVHVGDVFIVNCPYSGGVTHLNDLIVVQPIFSGGAEDGGEGDGKLLGFSANIAHYSDVGGMTPGSMSGDATEIYQEGLNLPGVKLIERGVPCDAVFDILYANSRMPDYLKGDLWAAIASIRIGVRRIREIAQKYGADVFTSVLQRYFDYAEQVTLHSLKRLPNRTFTIEEEQDSGVYYRARIEITDDQFLVDLTESDDQDKGPFNLSPDCAAVCGQLVLKSLTSPHTRCNGGTFRPLKVITRKGSVFDPVHPAAHAFYYEVNVRLYDLLWRAVAEGLPELLPAGHFASICGTMFGGTHPDTGRHYSVIEPELGGWGASHKADGNTAIFSGIHGDVRLRWWCCLDLSRFAPH